jgi:hypothetical protein
MSAREAVQKGARVRLTDQSGVSVVGALFDERATTGIYSVYTITRDDDGTLYRTEGRLEVVTP